MGRRILSLLLALTAGVGLAACGQAPSPAEGQETASPEAQNSTLLIAYAPETEGDPVAQAATLLAETLGGDVVEMGQEEGPQPQRLRVCPPGLCRSGQCAANGGGDLPGHL